MLVVKVFGDGDDVAPEVSELCLGGLELDLAHLDAVLDLPLEGRVVPVQEDHAVEAADLRANRRRVEVNLGKSF